MKLLRNSAVVLVVIGLVTVAHAEPAPQSPPPAGTWSSLGTGITGTGVSSLIVYGNQLIAAGPFTAAGGVSAAKIAAWDGTAWSALGGGIANATEIAGLAVHDNQLLVGGSFLNEGNGVKIWNGAVWSALAWVRGRPTGVASFDGRIFIARTEAFPPFGVQQAYVEYWSPTFSTWLYAGSFAPLGDVVTINAFGVVGGALRMKPSSTDAASYDGASWSSLGTPGVGTTGFVEFGGELFAGGYDPLLAKHTAPAQWAPLDANWSAACGWIFAMYDYHGQLVVGGDAQSPTCLPNRYLAVWDGSNWSTLGSGVNGPVRAFAEFNSKLIAAGEFTTADGNSALRIAQWTESALPVRKMTLGGIKAMYNKR